MLERYRNSRFLTRTAVGAGLLASSFAQACAEDPSLSDAVTIAPVANRTRIEAEALRGSFFSGAFQEENSGNYPPGILQAYPKLAESGLVPKRIVDIRSNGNAFARIYNYVDLDIDVESALGMYEYFDKTFEEPLAFKGFKVDSQDILVIALKMPILSRSVVFIPESTDIAPDTLLDSGLHANRPAATSVSFIKNETHSYVKVPKGSSAGSEATVSFATEVCQSMITTFITDDLGRPTPVGDIRSRAITQEIICNSYGLAVAAKTLGIPHEQYKRYVSDPTTSEIPLIEFGANEYGSIPKINPIIKTTE